MRATLAATVIAMTFPSGARAQPAAPPVDISFDGCDAADAAQIGRLVGVELRDRLLAAPFDLVIAVSCSPGVGDVRVFDARRGITVTRTVRLEGAQPATRARVLALAISEIVSWSSGDLVASAPVRPPPVPPVLVASEAPRRWAADLIGELRAPLSDGLALFGGALGSSLDLAPAAAATRAGIAADAGALAGDDSLTDVAVRALVLRVATTAWIGGAFRPPGWRWRADAGVEAGWARLVGVAPSPGIVAESVARPWAGPVASVAIGRRFGEHAELALAARGGWTAVSIIGTTPAGATAALRGPWAGAALSVHYR